MRSVSASTKHTEQLRQDQKASVIELFGRDYVRYKVFSIAVSASPFQRRLITPSHLVLVSLPLGSKNTPLQFLLALNDRIPHADTRSLTSWPAPPAYLQPLGLQTTDLPSLFP